jgi:hypothetical protein
MKERLKALEAKVAQKALILIEAQLVALEKAKSEKEATARAALGVDHLPILGGLHCQYVPTISWYSCRG